MSDPTSATPPDEPAAGASPAAPVDPADVDVSVAGPGTDWLLEPAIAEFVHATNDEDTDRFLAAFTDDAVLDDWGRTFTGRDEIARWNASDNIGVHSRFEVRGLTVNGDIHVVSIHVTGEGYNGGGSIAFQLADGLVSRVDITG